MSKSTHSPGPWKVDHENRIMGPERPVAIIQWGVDWRANASLIAAAPDLLAVVQKLVKYNPLHSVATWAEWDEMIRDARAAIAKATGEKAEAGS